ncbi:hypothetical protein FGO68_gene11696 [Halteria grandinella]|uniref:TLDc domain-containing protein n=1 Tax=Halteria grandinella TaxID=5974 RepID=A0A8J8NJG4_HALGN|nr:hypothetical protein FGO68_gene11696 [Halteria grandinella]
MSIIYLALLTTITFAQTANYIGNCENAFSFAEAHTPGTKFTCSNQTTSKVWNCKVIEVMFPICSKEEQCKSFNCQLRKNNKFDGNNVDITAEEGEWLLQQIQVPNLKLKPVLLYQGTRDGWDVTDYHSKVDGFPNTYTFLKYTQTQRRAAGFMTLAQSSKQYWNLLYDNLSFVLSIEKRLVAKASIHNHIVLQSYNIGPIFQDEGLLTVFGSHKSPLNKYGEAHCGRAAYYFPYEDLEKNICSLSGLQDIKTYHDLDELEVWQIL